MDELRTLAMDLRVAIGKASRRLREQGHAGDLTSAQLQVLHRLEREGPATVTALARAAGMRPQSMGATIAALETAGFASGAPDPHDGRQTVWSLTPKCLEWVKASRAAREDWLYQAIQAKFTDAEHADLARVVQLLERLVADPQ